MVININYYKEKKNLIRLIMYLLLTGSIWYYVLDANSQIKQLYNEDYYKPYDNSNQIQLNVEDLNQFSNNTPKIVNLNETLPGVLFRLFWDLIGIMFSLIVIIILWVCENFKSK